MLLRSSYRGPLSNENLFCLLLLMVFYLVEREKAYFLLDALPRLFLPWATGYENWDGITLAGQNRGRQVTSGTLLVTFPLSPVSYSSTFLFSLRVPTPINFISCPSLGDFALS